MQIPRVSGSRLFVYRGVERAHESRRKKYLVASVLVVSLAVAGMGDVTYTVLRGDNLSRIAKRYGTTVKAIAEANHIANPSLIAIGLQLRIPGAQPANQSSPPAVPTASPTQGYIVIKGDRLAGIAAKFKTSVQLLVQLNKLKDRNRIFPGQVLQVPAPTPLTVEQLLDRYSQQYGVDAALVKAVAWQESRWHQDRTSPAGAVGVMQVLPETSKLVQKLLMGDQLDINNVEHNIRIGVRLFAYLLTNTKGDESLAVAGYFQGLRSVRTTGMNPRTERYVANVMALRERFKR